MAVDHRLIIKKLQGLEAVFISFAQTTRMPYVECDEETFDDQAYLFAEEENAKQWAMECGKKQIPLVTVKVEKDQLLMLYSSLYLMGVNRLAFHNGAGFTYLPLEQVVTMKQPEEAKDGLPRSNATLQLTMIYFLQELRRPGQSPQDMERRKRLVDMEQEMMVNLIRAKYIMAVEMGAAEGEPDSQKPGQNIRIPYLKNPNGEIMQPLFSDIWEFQKFSRNYASKLQLATVPFKGLLPSLVKESKGYVLNPAGVGLMLMRDKLEMLVKQAE